jgi:hypothetical protein
MAPPTPSFDRLPPREQDLTRSALERCKYRFCKSSLDSVAADILATRAHRKDVQ